MCHYFTNYKDILIGYNVDILANERHGIGFFELEC